jgi:UPF0716 protein FxsA
MRIPILVIVLTLILAEIAVFILVGESIGVLATLALTLFGMIAGALLVRNQGIATLMRVRAETAAGRLPARPLAEGAVLVVAGLLIMLPGFITDLVGLALFVPAVREALWRAIRRRIAFGTATAEMPQKGGVVVELDRGDYASRPGPDSPWRRNGEYRT